MGANLTGRWCDLCKHQPNIALGLMHLRGDGQWLVIVSSAEHGITLQSAFSRQRLVPLKTSMITAANDDYDDRIKVGWAIA